MTDEDASQARRRMPTRVHSTFAARTARDDGERLNRRGSLRPVPSSEETPLLADQGNAPGDEESRETSQGQYHGIGGLRDWYSSAMHTLQFNSNRVTTNRSDGKRSSSTDAIKPRPGAFPRPVGGTEKLGTFAGVFVPTTLNVLSILMFLRFGVVLAQTGVVGMIGMLVICYLINLLTTMSISAIATNGTVRGGGAYYLISRSLGPEFGGSIGIVFYLGLVFNTSMNAVGLIDCFIENFGADDGSWAQWMQQGFWWQFLWATLVLCICTGICFAGSGIFARCSNGLLLLLLIATFSIPASTLLVQPFTNAKERISYTGLSLDTLRENLMPQFKSRAAGSADKHRPNFQDMFGILFPATGGIFAGASMSGDLKHPSKAIPKGTLYGLALTFFSYTIVILSMGASITRESLYSNTNVIQLTNVSGVVILLGEFATSAFSVLMGVIGSAKLLQALARDSLLPGLSIFGQGTPISDDPTNAIIITYVLAQLTMLSDINQIASFITMTYLMTFLVTNLACFLLKIGSAPNFRPSFHFFNWQTAAIGTIASGATMFFVDGMYASACVGLLVVIFLLIHYTTPPKPWGDVSQSLIYHQVRKYLLRLRQEHVKFWRPQILLLVNDPRRQYKLIQFCNSLKKGALFVLGHVIVSDDFGAAVPEARRQQQSWTKYIDFSKIKAFVNIAISPAVEWGTRNIVLGAGLGGMRPNIVVMGFYNLGELRQSKPQFDIPSPQPSRPSSRAANYPISRKAIQAAAKRRQTDQLKLSGMLPTDTMKPENAIGIQSYVTILEDLLLRLQINVAVAKGFQDLDIPNPKPTKKQRMLNSIGLANHEDEEPTKTYIDLWPIQMSAESPTPGTNEDAARKSTLTTNFDTYTLILQLGCILHTVPSWKRTYKLRVAVFVEYETDVEEERERVTMLLKSLRIEADVLVFWLASGNLESYEVVVNGKQGSDYGQAAKDVDDALEDEEWWAEVQKLRKPEEMSASTEFAQAGDLLEAVTNWPTSSFQHGRRESKPKRFAGLKKLLKRRKRQISISNPDDADATDNAKAQRPPKDIFSDSELSSAGGSDEEDEAIATDSDIGTSGDYVDEYDLEASDDENDGSLPPVRRSKSTSATGGIPFISSRLNLRRALWKGSPQQEDRPTSTSVSPLKPHPNATASDTAIPQNSKSKASSIIGSPKSQLSSSSQTKAFRAPPVRHQSLPKFTSKPQPRTAVATDDAAGPSIMFVDTPSPSAARKTDPISTSPIPPSQLATLASTSTNCTAPSPLATTIPTTPSPSTTTASPLTTAPLPQTSQASGFPLQSAIPLSFNDLPCRAQHLILNELIRQNSDDTAVVFTTLPSPVQGTGESETESVKFISDLEVLCQGLPPCLLVHSNSMTVTMNL